MICEYRTTDYNTLRMDYRNPFVELEPLEDEIQIVDKALDTLVAAGILPHKTYDRDKFLAHRRAVAELFEIPWTAITPRMQRLLYAISAIKQPRNMLAAGVFCGNTFFSNAGAAAGPGKCYEAESVIGIEILPQEAERAERNVRRIDPSGLAKVVAADAVDYVAEFAGQIDLLYLDADGDERRGKGIYFDILKSGLDKMPKGSLVLAYNSVNSAQRLAHYLEFVRDRKSFSASINVIFDDQGLEVSVR